MNKLFLSHILGYFARQVLLLIEWLKTKLMNTNILFGFITKTKLIALVLDWLKTKQIKTKETSPLSTKTKLMSLVFSRS